MTNALFPQPKALRSQGSLNLSGRDRIALDPKATDRLAAHVLRFADECALPVKPEVGKSASSRDLLTIVLGDENIAPQGYRIRMDGGITLASRDEAGAFYGLMTLKQLFENGLDKPLSIDDEPDFPARGYMLDISRDKVPTMETMFRLVDLLAVLKLNYLELYMEHTFAFRDHGVVWQGSSPFTAAEILRLDAYCRERYVDLVPNLNSFGHLRRWLEHPEYRHLAECPDGYTYETRVETTGFTLKPDAASLAFVASLYDEMLPNFTSPYFNVGCDETVDLGLGASKELCKKKGKTRVYVDYLLEIYRLVTARGRQMMFWGDIILHEPQYIKELPKDLIGLVWGYEHTHPFAEQCAAFADSGIPFRVAPGTSSWNSLLGRTDNMLGNIRSACKNGKAAGAGGVLNTDWGDNGHHQYLPVSYAGIISGACFSWSQAANENLDIAAALEQLCFRDQTGRLGGIFRDAGNVYLLANDPVIHNSTRCNNLFFRKKHCLDFLKAEPLRATEKRLRELAEELPATRPAAPDGSLIKRELANNLAMALSGIRYGLAELGDAPYSARERRADLAAILGEHEELWLARNRPGGLSTSGKMLRDLISEDAK
jgi:hypothetical protein